MKKWMRNSCLPVIMLGVLLMFGTTAQAKTQDTIKNGIFAGEISLAGMTEEQAASAVEKYIEGLRGVEIVLLAADGNQVTVTAGEIGIYWSNPGLVSEAVRLGTRGNVIERYKALKDLEHENKIYPIELDFDLQAINDILINECAQFDTDAVDYSLVRENGQFRVIEGRTGYMLDVETSIDRIYDYLTDDWDCEPCSIQLDVFVDEPRGSLEELSAVQDILGSFTTSFADGNSSRAANVINGCKLVDGALLYPGEELSVCDALVPFTEANGYYPAGAYLNGKVVDELGGGVCQVSTTLYNAVLNSELEVTERYNHSMIVGYVEPSADAAIAEGSKDFKFMNNLDYPIYIEGYTENRKITFNIYGKETRDEGHRVSYVSEVLEVINPVSDDIYADASQPIGYITTESAHIGYKARLWKVVTENGVEVSRTQVNSSSYKMVPRSATVGIATDDPQAYEEIVAAIGTGSIDHVKNVIALLVPPEPAPEAEE